MMNVELTVDGEDVPLTDYPEKALYEILAGFFRSLHGIEPETWKHAQITIER